MGDQKVQQNKTKQDKKTVINTEDVLLRLDLLIWDINPSAIYD